MLLKSDSSRKFSVAIAVSLVAAIAFYFSTKATLHDLDYTNQIASALLHGQLGLQEKPPDWLNEMIPWEGRYYSAFPLGAVLSMLPVALLLNTGPDPELSRTFLSSPDGRPMRLFLFSTRKGMRS